MVLVTGDTHGKYDMSKFYSPKSVGGWKLGKNDSVIILGDFGGVWYGDERDDQVLDVYAEKPYTIYFVDGNHENFEILYSYPEVEVNGAKCHKIRDNLYHVMRGEILEIDDLKIFCFGGASSHDKEYRTEGISWWPKELATEEEFIRAERNLDRVNWKVDYIVSHCAPTPVVKYMADWYGTDVQTNRFGVWDQKLDYEHWFFGHFHINRKVDDKHTALYDLTMRLW